MLFVMRLVFLAQVPPIADRNCGARKAFEPPAAATPLYPTHKLRMNHLSNLEAESIEIIREAVALSEKPVMMYSIGKDSSVMLHLACKAFWPARPPFPLLHIDTTWKFREMISFRDRMAAESGLKL